MYDDTTCGLDTLRDRDHISLRSARWDVLVHGGLPLQKGCQQRTTASAVGLLCLGARNTGFQDLGYILFRPTAA